MANKSDVLQPCVLACPLHTNVRGYIQLILFGDYEGALKLIMESNPLPSVCGRVCFHPCETACRRNEVDEPLSIRELKRFVTDRVKPKKPEIKKRDERVAVVGSGPAGLAAAHYLALRGYGCTVFDSSKSVGGMLVSCIPEFRLPREVLGDDADYIKKLGVKFKLNHHIGAGELKKLAKEYEAVFVAIGTQGDVKLGLGGEELDGIYGGLEFLKKVNSGEKPALGRHVAVIGGGNTAIDSARVAVRLGAEVTVVYRRSREEMPAYEHEVEEAEEEGVKFMFLASPVKFLGEKKLKALECTRMRLSAKDESGRRKPVPIKGSEFKINVDSVITAVGQKPVIDLGLNITNRGRLKVDDGLQTSINNVYAGGDAVTGPSSIVEAIASGRMAAAKIDERLSGQKVKMKEKEEVTPFDHKLICQISKQPQIEPKKTPKSQRALTTEVDKGFTKGESIKEALRCVSCYAGASVVDERCVACLTCVRLCPYEVPKIRGDTAFIDPSQCQACSICFVECPAEAIVMNNNLDKIIESGVVGSVKKDNVLVFKCMRVPELEEVPVVRVPCVTHISDRHIILAFGSGASAVYLLACPEGECIHGMLDSVKHRIGKLNKLITEAKLGSVEFVNYDKDKDIKEIIPKI